MGSLDRQGRGAPTGQPIEHGHAPAGRMNRPVVSAGNHAPRRGAGRSGSGPVGALRRRSFPPATFSGPAGAGSNTAHAAFVTQSQFTGYRACVARKQGPEGGNQPCAPDFEGWMGDFQGLAGDF